MKKIILFTFIHLFNITLNSQTLPDSVIKKYNAAQTSWAKHMCIFKYLYSFNENDSLWSAKVRETKHYFEKQNNEAELDYIQLPIASKFNERGDYTNMLNTVLPVLPRFMERGDTNCILRSHYLISVGYESSKNYNEAIMYMKRQIPILLAKRNNYRLMVVHNWVGQLYARASIPDSGIFYAQRAMAHAEEIKDDTVIVVSLVTLAQNYLAKKDYDLALTFLRKGLRLKLAIVDSLSSQGGMVNFTYDCFSRAFLGSRQYDSAQYYARLAISFCPVKYSEKERLLSAYECLLKAFDATGQSDSANKYLRMATAIRDTMYSLEKIKSIEAIKFNDQLRQQELVAEKLQVEEDRRMNIQFVAIGIGIISLLILFLLLSRSIIVTPRFVKIFGIIGLLITFEFLNLLLHPVLENITHHSPILMLLALASLAALLVPLHHNLEKWITSKLVEKNQKIRLAKAKKIIEEAETKVEE